MGIEFADPLALALLPVVPLVVWLWRRSPRPAVAWPGADRLRPLGARSPLVVTTGLLTTSLTCGVAALAGPRLPLPGDRLETEGINLVLVVDVSGSMAEADFLWDGEATARLSAVKRALGRFIAGRPQDRVGLVLFAAHPETATPLTADHAALVQTLEAAEPRGIPTESETNLGDAVAWALARLRNAAGRSALVVFSDGEHNVPAPALTPRQAGQLAAGTDVPVSAVFAGPPGGAGLAGLQALARMTGGSVFSAADGDELTAALKSIDQLTRSPATDPRRRRFRELVPSLALVALGCGIVAVGLNRGPWLTVPG
jgi:Ca-activated chloride channel family protein